MSTHFAVMDGDGNLQEALCGESELGDMFSCGEQLVTCPDCRRLKGWTGAAPRMYGLPSPDAVAATHRADLRTEGFNAALDLVPDIVMAALGDAQLADWFWDELDTAIKACRETMK